LDADRLATEEWGTVILDEAQAIKNPESQVAQAAFRLRAEFKLTMTGTPVRYSALSAARRSSARRACSIATSSITVMQYLNVYVNDTNGNPLEFVNVYLWTVQGDHYTSDLTGSDGRTHQFNVTEAILYQSSSVYYNNYTISY